MSQLRVRIIIASVVGGVVITGLAISGGAARVQAEKKALAPAGNQTAVTIDVKDTDIGRVLDAFSQQTGLSVVIGKEVSGAVSVRLFNVQWDQALEAILKPYGFGYERTGDVIVVLPLSKLNELNEAQLLTSRVFRLRFKDAGDVKSVIEGLLSSRGKVQVLEETGQKGWEFGAFGAAGSGAQAIRSATSGTSATPRRSYKGAETRRSRSKTVVVTDISAVLDRVADMLASVDVMPQQILIESRFLEVDRDRLKDLGLEFGTGANGTDTAVLETTPVDQTNGGLKTVSLVGVQSLNSLAKPAAFSALSSGISGVIPFETGLTLAFQKLTGTQFDVILHALEEDVHTNTLSAPSIMTLDNQEANILVGTQYPILTSSVAGTTSTTTVTSLDYYQDIGIQLRVVPQIAGDDHINMIVHPAVTSFSSTVSAKNAGGFSIAEYPIISTREAETQVLLKNGDTVVIGGLLKDLKTKGFHKVPVLGDIPILGWAFQRQTDDITKIDLLIFITAQLANEQQVATQKPVFEPAEPGPKATIRWKQSAAPDSVKVSVKQTQASPPKKATH